VGEKVWLKATELNVPTLGNVGQRLGPLFHGPYEITEVPSSVTVKLKLPDGFRRHPVFHISNVKKWVSGEDGQFSNRAPPEPPEALDVENDIWGIEKLLDKRWSGNHEQVLVRWEGFGPSDDQWKSVSRLNEKALEEAKRLPLSNPEAKAAYQARLRERQSGRGTATATAVTPAVVPAAVPVANTPAPQTAQRPPPRRSARNNNSS